MNPHRLLLVLSLLLPLLIPASSVAAPPEAAPKSALPAIDQLKQNVLLSQRGLGLMLQNARFYAGWVPRGFITAALRYRPSLLPGKPLSEEQWQDSGWQREGIGYIPGITDWGARYMAQRADQTEALTEANWDLGGSARVGFGLCGGQGHFGHEGYLGQYCAGSEQDRLGGTAGASRKMGLRFGVHRLPCRVGRGDDGQYEGVPAASRLFYGQHEQDLRGLP